MSRVCAYRVGCIGDAVAFVFVYPDDLDEKPSALPVCYGCLPVALRSGRVLVSADVLAEVSA